MHYWINGSYSPPCPVVSTPFTAVVEFKNQDTLIETRRFDPLIIVLCWVRQDTVPVDLKTKIIGENKIVNANQ
jgi:hypothetical protein